MIFDIVYIQYIYIDLQLNKSSKSHTERTNITSHVTVINNVSVRTHLFNYLNYKVVVRQGTSFLNEIITEKFFTCLR